MAQLLYGKSLLIDCVILLGDTRSKTGWPGYLRRWPWTPIPKARSGRSGIEVITRCPDFGEVEVQIWAGDPGSAGRDWNVVFDGSLETAAGGFGVASMGKLFHIDATPGAHRLRAEAHPGPGGHVDAVRFIFPDSPSLKGEELD